MFRPISSGFLAVSFREKKPLGLITHFWGSIWMLVFNDGTTVFFSAPKRWGNDSQF